jgi:hypothetical protein
MNWYVIIPIALILVFFIIFITKLSIKVVFVYTPGNQQCLVKVKAWFGIIHYTFDVFSFLEKKMKQKKYTESDEKEEEREEKEQKGRSFSEWMNLIPDLIKIAQDIHTMLKDFLRRVKIKKWTWTSQLGTEDAAATGVLTGFAWSLKGMVVGLATRYMKLKTEPELQIHPVFQGNIMTTQLECIISFRVFRAMIAGWKVFQYVRKKRSVFISEGTNEFSSEV